MLKTIAVRFFKARWGSLLPLIFKAAAEGRFGAAVEKLYWLAEGRKTFTGAVLMGIGTGLEAVAAAYPELAWAPAAARVVFAVGACLSAVGLVDGGVRAPWPKGTAIPPEEKQ